MNDRNVVLVRQAIFNVLDEREWDFTDDEQRVDFADRVVTFLPSPTASTSRDAVIEDGRVVCDAAGEPRKPEPFNTKESK